MRLVFSFMDCDYEGSISQREFELLDEDSLLDEIEEIVGQGCSENISLESFKLVSFSNKFDGFTDGSFSVLIVYKNYSSPKDDKGKLIKENIYGNIFEEKL